MEVVEADRTRLDMEVAEVTVESRAVEPIELLEAESEECMVDLVDTEPLR